MFVVSQEKRLILIFYFVNLDDRFVCHQPLVGSHISQMVSDGMVSVEFGLSIGGA